MVKKPNITQDFLSLRLLSLILQVLKLPENQENLKRSIPLIVDKSLINLDDNFIFSLILISTCCSLLELLIKISECPTSKILNNGISLSRCLLSLIHI